MRCHSQRCNAPFGKCTTMRRTEVSIQAPSLINVSVFRRPSCRLSFLPSVRASEAELTAVDFMGNDALVECGADGLIQAL